MRISIDNRRSGAGALGRNEAQARGLLSGCSTRRLLGQGQGQRVFQLRTVGSAVLCAMAGFRELEH